MSLLTDKILNLPAVPGVYLFKDGSGRVLYVGKAKSLQHRVRNYLGLDALEARIREMVESSRDLDWILTDSEAEALLLEATLIRQHRPHFNILLKDDKSFPYVRVSVQEEWPRLSVTRQVRGDGARYLGPYVDVRTLRRTLREIRRIFPIRTCRNFEDYRRRNRPCLYYHIRRCAGPCTTRAHVERSEYRAMVDSLLLFLTGKDEELLARLRDEMRTAAEAREYESAARRRDQIDLLEKSRVPQAVVRPGARDADLVGVGRHGARASVVVLLMRGGRVVGKESRLLERAGELDDAQVLQSFLAQRYLANEHLPPRIATAIEPADAAALAEALSARAGQRVALVVPARGRERPLVLAAERNAALALEDLAARAAGRRARVSADVLELQKALALSDPPYRMVCFDISNLGAGEAVAAVVASENGRARRGLYRRMRMRHPGPDDFAMIGEAVERYWTRVESGEMPRPDLVVIDGGAGQLGAARSALERVATRPAPLIALAKREETIVREGHPDLRLPHRSAALRALQRLRDEAHRFGLTYHRLLRSRARIGSALDDVPGVGPARRAALLKAFGSVDALRAANAPEIAAKARVPMALAIRVAERLHAGERERSA